MKEAGPYSPVNPNHQMDILTADGITEVQIPIERFIDLFLSEKPIVMPEHTDSTGKDPYSEERIHVGQVDAGKESTSEELKPARQVDFQDLEW